VVKRCVKQTGVKLIRGKIVVHFQRIEEAVGRLEDGLIILMPE
jgi:hypothetical protein